MEEFSRLIDIYQDIIDLNVLKTKAVRIDMRKGNINESDGDEKINEITEYIAKNWGDILELREHQLQMATKMKRLKREKLRLERNAKKGFRNAVYI